MLVPPWNTNAQVQRYNPYMNDVALQFLPWAKAVRQAWLHGDLPLRDRWNGCGTPLAANGASAAFSPLMFLTALLPLTAAFTLMAAVKLFLAMTGMWLWLRELGISKPTAFFGAVVFSFSFTFLPWLFMSLTAVECLWPWLLFSLELCRDRVGERRAFWLLVAVLTALPLGGHTESAVLGCLFAFLFLLARRVSGDFPEASRVARRAALASLAAVGLTAFSVLPQVLAILSSNRIVNAQRPFWSSYFSWLPHGPIWPAGAATTILPRALGDGIQSPIIAGAVAAFPEMAMGYISIVGWSCALLIFRRGSRRRKTAWALMGLAIAGFGVATAIWPFAEVAGFVPMLKHVFPIRFLALVALAGAALAAMELDRLVNDLQGSKRAALGALGAAGALMLVTAMIYQRSRPLHAASGGLPSQVEALWLAEASLATLIILVGLVSWKGRALAAFLPYALGVVAGVELGIQGARLYRTGRIDQLFPPTPLVQFLQRQPSPFRVVGEADVLFPSSNVFAGVEDARTHDPVERRDYVEFLDATCGYPPGDYFKLLHEYNAPALDFLNVRYLVSSPGRASPGEKWRLVYRGRDGTVFENRDVLPRVFAPGTVTFIAPVESRWGWVRNAFDEFGTPSSAIGTKKDWREQAFVLGLEAKVVENGRAEVTGYRESTNGASFRARVPAEAGAAVLVASLTQDGGWSARDEAGRRIDTTLANGPFLALRVPSGDHLVHLNYSPPGFRIGVWISAFCLLSTVLRSSRGLSSRFVPQVAPSPTKSPKNSRQAARMPLIWLAGATAVLIAGFSTSRLPSFWAAFRIPATPLDLTSDRYAHMWSFLQQTRDRVPEGASYTVIASNPDDEMYVYMFSLGILPKQLALPTSYFGIPQPLGLRARYILSFGGRPPGTDRARLTFRCADGAVYERPAGPR